MMKQEWIVFYGPDGRELCAITLQGLFEGEVQSTIGLLAAENGIPETSISFAQVYR